MKNTRRTPFSLNKWRQRVIGCIEGLESAPAVVFFGGIHGNEPAGMRALEKLFQELDSSKTKGSIYAIKGNLPALKKGVRFIDKDLNRMWTRKAVERLKNASTNQVTAEESEVQEIYQLLNEILERHSGPIYFIDLHTTSSKSIPFITINDAMINRKFSSLFPVPVVLGIEEFLEGPLLSFINEKGYVSLGFEAGRHTDNESTKNSLSFVKQVLHHTNILSLSKEELSKEKKELSESAKNIKTIYEVNSVYKINDDKPFEMFKGYDSFQNVKKGMPLARSNGQIIYTEKDTTVFMPLYQKKGREGFFLIRKIPKIFLWASSALRWTGMDRVLTYLPGVSWENEDKEALRVNLKTARFLTKQIFHLLGYRSWQKGGTTIIMSNRERIAKKKRYKAARWY